ncbi:hypothetical protein [Tsukamurella spumae]|uniref:Carboxymuconolactone decarboxylase family protein n=1 Tax=Tsukamurella spumae TaxID=44753 RepID=A0A846X7C6_9ACTN|nr:hypothetical protein [Tsukamurella spumae]NKY20475.1 hypothetical protein [Tsukamurella spumae]
MGGERGGPRRGDARSDSAPSRGDPHRGTRTDIGPAESPEAAFVDQFVDYVADIDDALRAPLAAKYGKSLRNFVEAVYIIDQSVRLGLTHARLFPAVDADFEAVPEPAEILPPTRANMKWHDEILAHGVMDDLMREVVRLRGSWYHDCDLCNSCRLVDGQTVVVDADLEARIHTYREGTMSPAHTAALAYADAYMVDPAAMPEELADELRSRFTRAELLALTLEMSSWNYQKVLVALAIDHPVSTEGFTAITVGSDGALQIGELLRS